MRTIARAPEWALGKLSIGDHMWVSIGASGQLQRISIPLGIVNGSASVPDAPGAISWDGSKHLYVAETGATSVATVKLSTSSVDGTISIGSAPVSFARDATYMYGVGAGGTITRINISTGLVSGSVITVPSSNGVPNRAAWDNGSFTFVTLNNADPSIAKILRITNASWPSYTTYNLGETNPGPLAWDGGSYLYAITQGNTVTKISLATGLPVKTINAPKTLGHEILWDGATHLYLTAAYSILTLNLATDTFDTIIPMSVYSVTGLAKDGSGNIYSGNFGSSSTIVKISIATRAIVATLAGFDYPNSIAWDGGSYMWVVSAVITGAVYLVSISSFTISATVTLSPTAYVPDQIAWDGGSYMYITQPYNNRVYRIAIAAGHAQNVIAGFSTGGYTQSLAWDGVAHMVFSNNSTNTVSTVLVSAGTAIDRTFVTGSWPSGFVRDGSGNLHLTNQLACTLSRISFPPFIDGAPISVGSVPMGAARDGSGHMYVCNAFAGTISRISIATGLVDSTLAVNANPRLIAWDGGDYMYVVHPGVTSTIGRILISTFTTELSVGNAGNNSTSIAWDGGSYLYITNEYSNDVTRVLISTGSTVGSIAVGDFPSGVAWDHGLYMYVTNRIDATVTRIRISTGLVQDTISGFSVATVSPTWDGAGHMWVGSNIENHITRVTVATGTILDTINVPYPPEHMGWDGRDRMFVSGDTDGRIHSYRISTLVDEGYVQPLGGLVHEIAWDGLNRMYVTNYDVDSVCKIALNVDAVDRTTNIPDYFDGIAWDGSTHLYFTDSALNQVRRIVSATGAIDKVTPVGSAPKKVAWDGGSYMYVTNSGDNTVSTIEVATGNTDGAPIPVGTSPDEIVWDGADHLYVTNKGSNNVSRIKKGSWLRNEGETSFSFGRGVIDGSGHLYFITVSPTVGVGRITLSTGVYDALVPFTDSTTDMGRHIEWDGGQYLYILSNPYFHYPQPIKIYRIDINTLVLSPFVDLGVDSQGARPGVLRWDGGSYLYTEVGDKIYRIEIATGSISTLTITAPPASFGVASLAWDGGSYMYAGISDSTSGFQHGYVRRFLISSFTWDSTILSVPGTPIDIAWDNGSYMYVTNYDGWGAIITDTVTRIQKSDFTIYDDIPLPGRDPEYVLWGGKNLMYVIGEGNPPSVHAIDIATGTLVQTLTGFTGYLFDPVWDGRNRIYISCTVGLAKVAIQAGAVDATIPVAGVPTGLAWDGPKR